MFIGAVIGGFAPDNRNRLCDSRVVEGGIAREDRHGTEGISA